MSITEAKIACNAAWKAAPNAEVAWCCHHEIELEWLRERAQTRIDWLALKPIEEQIARYNNFRPVLSELPAEVVKAHKTYQIALECSSDAWDKRENTLSSDPKFAELREAYNQACDEAARAERNYDEAISDNQEEISRLHKIDVPNHTWNGIDIF